MKKALVCGAGGFIGGHLVGRLLDEGYEVHALDIKTDPDWYQLHLTRDVDRFFGFDLRNPVKVKNIIRINQYDEIYQLAADMGGAGYIFTGDHDADVMHNSATINLNVAQAVAKYSKHTKVFYSSSACIYPAENQTDPENPNCKEDSAYPANPDSEYGWEKLFSERLWRSYARNYGLDVRIARFHNIFGPNGTWDGGKEKAPAAICRKVIQADESIEVWGDGEQTRSFMYIDECIKAVRLLMNSDVTEVINIGSDEMVTINELVNMALDIGGKTLKVKHIPGPEGVRGRNSDNVLIKKLLDWAPQQSLYTGLEKTYTWIEEQINEQQ